MSRVVKAVGRLKNGRLPTEEARLEPGGLLGRLFCPQFDDTKAACGVALSLARVRR